MNLHSGGRCATPVILAFFLVACGDDGAVPVDKSTPDSPASSDGSAALADGERQTELGVVRGVREGDTWVFRGIPYAAPAIGELRFRPPEPHPGWNVTREGSAFGEVCAHVDPSSGEFVGSEDCLTLNVWMSAESSAASRPVMVWIHGGDNVSGSTSATALVGRPLYDGRQLVERGNVVYVSIQYRLGAFGFLSHPGFAADNEHGATGNWGLMDQLAALAWVQRNIGYFGGDPTNVTIFGQSAGADDICALVASPRGRGLFDRAIIMSAGGCHTNDATVSARITEEVTEAVGCGSAADEVACLREVAVETLARAPQRGSPLHPDRVDFYVEVDGWVLTEPPIETFRSGTQNAVPLIFGTTTNEYGKIFANALPESIPAAEYRAYIAFLFGPTLADAVVAAYPPAEYGSEHAALVAAFGDAVHHCSVRAMARAASESQTEPVYRYVFALQYEDDQLRPYGAAHGFDVPLVFANNGDIVLTAEEKALSDALLSAFTRFAHTGDPDPDGSDDWPRFDGASDRYAIAEEPWSTLSGFRSTQCHFWDSVWSK